MEEENLCQPLVATRTHTHTISQKTYLYDQFSPIEHRAKVVLVMDLEGGSALDWHRVMK